MPELPEVETIRRSLERAVLNKKILGVHVREERLRVKADPESLKRAIGMTIYSITRRSKYLIFHLQGDLCLVLHLGMSGRLLLVPLDTPYQKHDHVILEIEGNHQLRFRDPRRFGLVELIEAGQLTHHKHFASLGIEPLTPAFNADFLFDRTRHLKKPVKNFLMDGNIIVGVGNIYANESLFLAGIRPTRPVGKLNRQACAELSRSVRKVLQTAIKKGGTTISDFLNSNGETGYFQLQLRVYDRAQKPCYRCKSIIRRKVMAGRSTFYCTSCQK